MAYMNAIIEANLHEIKHDALLNGMGVQMYSIIKCHETVCLFEKGEGFIIIPSGRNELGS